MDNKKGLHEELQLQNVEYPENKKIYPLAPNEYSYVLTQYVANTVGTALHELSKQEKYEDMIRLVQKIERQVKDEVSEWSRPLASIHYRYDDDLIPLIYPELFFSKPFLVTNQNKQGQNFFKVLRAELLTADHVDFMVSFIRWSGLQLLLRSLSELQKKNTTVRILTSTYLNVTEPKALRRLLDFENVQVKIFDSGKTSFHTKAYLFSRYSDMNTIIIGSSNLSSTAIQHGFEWNVKLPDVPLLPIYQNAAQLFTELWNDERSKPLTQELINDYEKEYRRTQQKTILDTYSYSPRVYKVSEPTLTQDSVPVETQILEPNSMQKQALLALSETRKRGKTKGIVIAATGTGKTYLSAFDVKQMNAQTVLFLAHRDELLENAKQTFASVFGSEEKMGKVTGTVKEWDKPFLFSTVQTLYKEEYLKRFSPFHFDYIVVDEFHHAEADTYRKIIDYFKPKFLLGITATPERMDGRDVLALCDHNVVYEIRLHQALEAGLLAPFHYFGLGDTVDYEQIPLQNGYFDEKALVKALNSHERVDYIIEMIEKFGYDGKKRRALCFCASVEHAKYMAEEFNRRGYVAACLTGADDPCIRKQTVERLEDENDPLEFIFTVNIFNEGIDIPSLNLVLFLRPTESATIFIQQLGRGLRKSKDKEFVTILDFIGNYQRSFIVPLALSGQTNHKAFDRDSLRVVVETDFANLPDGCFVELEEISRQKILEKIKQIRMDDRQMLAGLYGEFRRELGRSPEIEDFLYTPSAPSLHYFIQKFGSWVQTKERMNDTNSFDERILNNPYLLEMVQRLEQSLPLKWPYEFAILSLAKQYDKVSVTDVTSYLTSRFGVDLEVEQHESYILRAMERLAAPYKKQKWVFGRCVESTFIFDEEFKKSLNLPDIDVYIVARMDYGLTEFRRTYNPTSFFKENQKVQLYQNYTRNELMYLFQSTAKEGSWREGISRVDNHYLFFVTLNKDKNKAERLQYNDHFIDTSHFHWQSSNQTSHASERGQDYIHHKERGLHIHLFVRKFEQMYGETLPFTYVGELDYVSSVGDKPMNIKWKLHHALPQDLFNDFVR